MLRVFYYKDFHNVKKENKDNSTDIYRKAYE